MIRGISDTVKPRDKGTRAETEVVSALLRNGFPMASRAPLWGARDRGDVVGVPFVVSVKDQREMRLSSWVDDLGGMMENSGMSVGVVWHKRAGRGRAEQWYVTTTGELWLSLWDGPLRG